MIKDIASDNGYSPAEIDKMINKFRFRHFVSSSSTYTGKPETKFLLMAFQPRCTRGFEIMFLKLGYNGADSSRNNTRQTYLASTEATAPTLEKSGIYEISCTYCNENYIGHLIPVRVVRVKEHLEHTRFGRTNKSSSFRAISTSFWYSGLQYTKVPVHSKQNNCYIYWRYQ